ncbi:MAG TPA: diguanylate cyclase [Candidatus Limnocylindrales bacterium]
MSTILTERVHRRSRLLLIVFGVSLVLVATTGAALVAVVGNNVEQAALSASVASDQSIESALIETNLPASALSMTGVTPGAVIQIQDQLRELLVHAPGILHVKIFAPDGTVLYSNVDGLRGRNLGPDDDLEEAFDTGKVAPSIVGADDPDAATTGLPPEDQLVEEYFPIRAADGTVPGVFEIYRDATPILTTVADTTREVLAVVVAAAIILSLLLYGIFQAAQRRLTRQTQALLEASRRDALTGLLNHGTTVAGLADLLERTRQDTGVTGVALIDIDNFRLVNETYGHEAGDLALLEVARIMRAEFDETSILGRYGPDEFLVIAPPDHSAGLETAIDRLRDQIADVSLQFGASERLPVTVSAGICYAPADGEAATELLAVAAVVLGEAKASGGNGVRVADAAPAALGPAERSSFDVLAGLVLAVDTKDRYTKRHSEDVARYGLFLADLVGVDPELRKTIEIAGLLHDVGKIGIPDGILRKPGPLTVDEYAIVKQHVALGDSIVRDVPNAGLVRAGVRHHHERWDGDGYLDRLSGEAIPLIARILAVGDAFSAMTTTRPYRKAMSIQEALHRLEDAAGSQLDPRLVTAFVKGIETSEDAPLPGDGRPLRRIWTPQSSVA